MDTRLRTDDETDSDISDLEELDLKLPDSADIKKIKWRQTVCYYLSYISEGMHSFDGAGSSRSPNPTEMQLFFFSLISG